MRATRGSASSSHSQKSDFINRKISETKLKPHHNVEKNVKREISCLLRDVGVTNIRSLASSFLTDVTAAV